MSNQEPPTTLQLKPIISYPREAHAGKTYLVSIDVQLATPDTTWNFPEEEYTIGFILNTSPYFTCEPLHEVWPIVILHRFGGTYGPAEFLFTAANHEIERGQISITLVNGWGIPMTRLELPCEVRLESGKQEKQEIKITSSKRGVASNIQRETADILIEEQLVQAGWVVQSMTNININTSQGIVIREFPLTTGIADYLFIIDGEAAGIIEVKRINQSLMGAKEQAELHQTGIQKKESQIRFTRSILPFSYETNGYQIIFTNQLEPETRSREVFHFHQPQTLAQWLRQAPVGTSNDLNDLLRSRLRRMPPLLRAGLRDCQFEAITNLERSLAENRPRALIHMASGTGKTYMTVNEIYRLLRFGGAKHILFLVDRNNLGQQIVNEFQQFVTPDTGSHFTEFYNVQWLFSNQLDSSAEICITTIQRLYSILRGKGKSEPLEEDPFFTSEDDENEPIVEMQYHPDVPIEYFDVIFIDECHRSIYGKWRPVIEYFDAFLIGMTAFPTAKTLAFFQRNQVMEYSRKQALADGIIVDYDIYRIRTELTEHGSRIEQGIVLPRRDKQTRKRRYEALRDDFIYEGSQVGRDIVAEDQIRTVLTAYRNNLPKLFPERSIVPKTVIFARDESHAEDILRMVREVFDKGNDFAKKITYSIAKGRSGELIKEFCNSYNPRIVVTVNMLLGIDIQPLECIILMRPIRSEVLYEQIIGLGSRTIQNTYLQTITPDALRKTHFILVDTVGVTYNLWSDNASLAQKPFMTLERLLTEVMQEQFDTDNLTSLAAHLVNINSGFTSNERVAVQKIAGYTLNELSQMLLDATNIDKQIALAKQVTGKKDPDPQAIGEAALHLAQLACIPYKNQELREILLSPPKKTEQLIDDVSIDHVISAQFDTTSALQIIASLNAFLKEHEVLIEDFKIAYNLRNANQLAQCILLLAEDFRTNNFGLTVNRVWHAYQILNSSQVYIHSFENSQFLPDMMTLVCYSLQRNTDADAILEPFQDTVNRRFTEWLNEQQKKRKNSFNDEQIRWLERIRNHIASNLQFEVDDFDLTPFSSDGGRVAAHYLFKNESESILEELNTTLVFGSPETQVSL